MRHGPRAEWRWPGRHAPPAHVITSYSIHYTKLYDEELRPILLMGREMGNDVVVIDPRTSRQHARIERRREGFFVVDQSTNGTFIANDGGGEQCIRGGEAMRNNFV